MSGMRILGDVTAHCKNRMVVFNHEVVTSVAEQWRPKYSTWTTMLSIGSYLLPQPLVPHKSVQLVNRVHNWWVGNTWCLCGM